MVLSVGTNSDPYDPEMDPFLPDVDLNITMQEIRAEPRRLKNNWDPEAVADFNALFNEDYKAWASRVADPNYKFQEIDVAILEKLGYPGITIEELQSGAIPPEISEDGITPE